MTTEEVKPDPAGDPASESDPRTVDDESTEMSSELDQQISGADSHILNWHETTGAEFGGKGRVWRRGNWRIRLDYIEPGIRSLRAWVELWDLAGDITSPLVRGDVDLMTAESIRLILGEVPPPDLQVWRDGLRLATYQVLLEHRPDGIPGPAELVDSIPVVDLDGGDYPRGLERFGDEVSVPVEIDELLKPFDAIARPGGCEFCRGQLVLRRSNSSTVPVRWFTSVRHHTGCWWARRGW